MATVEPSPVSSTQKVAFRWGDARGLPVDEVMCAVDNENVLGSRFAVGNDVPLRLFDDVGGEHVERVEEKIEVEGMLVQEQAGSFTIWSGVPDRAHVRDGSYELIPQGNHKVVPDGCVLDGSGSRVQLGDDERDRMPVLSCSVVTASIVRCAAFEKGVQQHRVALVVPVQDLALAGRYRRYHEAQSSVSKLKG